ncbi:MAG: hypothetical protein AABZ44_10740 [Elusimicrobiota bacterium]
MEKDRIEEGIDRILGAYGEFVKKVSEAYADPVREPVRTGSAQGRDENDRT